MDLSSIYFYTLIQVHIFLFVIWLAVYVQSILDSYLVHIQSMSCIADIRLRLRISARVWSIRRNVLIFDYSVDYCFFSTNTDLNERKRERATINVENAIVLLSRRVGRKKRIKVDTFHIVMLTARIICWNFLINFKFYLKYSFLKLKFLLIKIKCFKWRAQCRRTNFKMHQ